MSKISLRLFSKIFPILFLLFICLAFCGIAAADSSSVQFSGGLGTAADPYRITSVEQLNEIRHHPDSSFILMNDLDFAGSIQNWVPIGKENDLYYSFQGNFDGNNKTIHNLKIDFPGGQNNGLFYSIQAGSVSNLNFENASVTSKCFYAGVLAAMIGPHASVDNICISNSTVSGANYGGLLAGNIYESTVSNCTIRNSFLNSGAGGMIVSDNKGNVTNSNVYNCTLITANGGGITAHNTFGGIVDKCFITDSIIETESSAGGISCTVRESSVTNCYSKNVSISASNGHEPISLGGIAGDVYNSKIGNCYTTASVTSNRSSSRVGGIAGSCSMSQIENCISVNEKVEQHSDFFSISYRFKTGKIAGDETDSVFKDCYHQKGMKSNKIIFGGKNGNKVSSKEISDFPNGIWEKWDTKNWTENPNENDFLPIHESESD